MDLIKTMNIRLGRYRTLTGRLLIDSVEDAMKDPSVGNWGVSRLARYMAKRLGVRQNTTVCVVSQRNESNAEQVVKDLTKTCAYMCWSFGVRIREERIDRSTKALVFCWK